MCLSDATKISLKKDTIVYKVVKKLGDGTYRSPFIGTTYTPGTSLHTSKESYHFAELNSTFYPNAVMGGAYHTFKDKKTALQYAITQSILESCKNPYCITWGTPNHAVLECRIPKDTAYTFKGKFDSAVLNEKLDCYASADLEIIREINE